MNKLMIAFKKHKGITEIIMFVLSAMLAATVFIGGLIAIGISIGVIVNVVQWIMLIL